jgi:hypothetical protein
MATQEIINIGTLPNDGEGDPLRVAFGKINNNFSNLFATFVNTSSSFTVGNTPGQVIFETPANTFTVGEMTVYSADINTNNSQAVKLFAQIDQLGANIKFTGTGATFFGNALTSYDMVVSGGNVQILANPLIDEPLFHFIGSQNLWVGADIPGIPIELDGYSANSTMATEIDQTVTTEQV